MMNIRTRLELAVAYNVSTKTLRRWFIDADLDIPSGCISPANLALIYQKLGPPTNDMSHLGAKLPKSGQNSPTFLAARR